MAQIPIFDSGPPRGQADIRPTRLGPAPGELERQAHFQELGQLGNEMMSTAVAMNRQQQQNDWNTAHVSYGQQLNDAREMLDSQPFTSFQDYLDTAKKLSDPQQVIQPMNLGGRALSHVTNNLGILQNEFLHESMTKGMVLQHKKMQGEAEDNLDQYAQLMAKAGPKDWPLYRQMGMDAIAADEKTGIFNGEESVKRRDTFLHKADYYGAANYVLQDPAGAAHLFTSGEWKKQYSNLTPQDIFEFIGHAHRQLTMQENAGQQAWKNIKGDADNQAVDMMSGKAPVDGSFLAQAERSHLHPPGMYYTLTGQESPGDPELTKDMMGQIDTAQSPSEIDGIRNQLLMNPHAFSTDERKQIIARLGQTKTNMNNALTSARASLQSRIKTQILKNNDQYGVSFKYDTDMQSFTREVLNDAIDQARYAQNVGEINNILKMATDHLNTRYETDYKPVGKAPNAIPFSRINSAASGTTIPDLSRIRKSLEAAGAANGG